MNKIYDPWRWEVSESKTIDFRIDISNPPCASCVYWNPMRQITHDLKGDPRAAGVRLCWAPNQEFDFSCYNPKEI